MSQERLFLLAFVEDPRKDGLFQVLLAVRELLSCAVDFRPRAGDLFFAGERKRLPCLSPKRDGERERDLERDHLCGYARPLGANRVDLDESPNFWNLIGCCDLDADL